MKVKIKKLVPEAVIPKYVHPGDAGMDMVAVSKTIDKEGNSVYGTGLAFEVPEGYCMLLFPRSSNSRTNLTLTNHVGLCDSGYRGEVFFKYAEYKRANGKENIPYRIGERIGQCVIVPYPVIEFEEVEELSESVRGTNGYGSSGK